MMSMRTVAIRLAQTSSGSSRPGGGSITHPPAGQVDLGTIAATNGTRSSRARRSPCRRRPAGPAPGVQRRRRPRRPARHPPSTHGQPDQLVVVELVRVGQSSRLGCVDDQQRAAQRLGRVAVAQRRRTATSSRPECQRAVATVSGPCRRRARSTARRRREPELRVVGADLDGHLAADAVRPGRSGRRRAAWRLSGLSSASSRSTRDVAVAAPASRSRCAARWRCGRRGR